MRDLYEALGITSKSTTAEIKQAYRDMARSAHPDKGGSNETMTLLNEAYAVLTNPEKRKDFDEKWKAFNISTETNDTPAIVSGALISAGIEFSKSFREQHKLLVTQFQYKPVNPSNIKAYLEVFQFTSNNSVKTQINYHNVFSYIKKVTALHAKPFTKIKSLTPQLAISLFIDFLNGYHSEVTLSELIKHFLSEIDYIKSVRPLDKTILLYEGICNIFNMASEGEKSSEKILPALEKIIDYAKYKSEQTKTDMVMLFQHKQFRNLFLQAMHQYWNTPEIFHDNTNSALYDGRAQAKSLINNLKSRLANESSNSSLSKLIRYVHLLYKLESDIHKYTEVKQSDLATFYRKQAYFILDWIPALSGISSQQIIINTLLQAGLFLQNAAYHCEIPAIKMADEKLALRIYLLALGIAHYTTPDVELYAYMHCLKQITSFVYDNVELKEIIPALQHRALLLADIFPFYEARQSNIEFLLKEDKSIILMREYLHDLIAIVEKNQTNNEKIVIDHNYVTVFYQAYEACLKHWYEQHYDEKIEKNFRLKLMQELLSVNKWTFYDLDYNLHSPWLKVDKNDGWLMPTTCLPDAAVEAFSSIDGLQLNYKTGELTFILDPCQVDAQDYKRLLTLTDLSELFERNITAAIFSLDPADTDMAYHPFNKMRFAPSTLFNSQLLHTMLVTDYILKFLTVGQEVQGKHPYDMRSIDKFIQHLPGYLKKIIYDFHAANHSESLHRFWIEAENISVAVEDKEIDNSGIIKFALGELTMVVKKHKMVRDIDGNLVDQEYDEEGWNIYILSPQQQQEIQAGKRIIADSGIIFITGTNQFYCVENSIISSKYVINNYDQHLKRLFKLKRDTNEKVSLDASSVGLIYKILREINRQTDVPHKFSPEFIFAQEFTTHYNEFAQYFPEFGRLRELSRLVGLVRILSRQYDINKENISELKKILNDTAYWQNIEAEIKGKVSPAVKGNFSNWSNQFSTAKIKYARQQTLSDLRRQIGSITFTKDSPEIQGPCQKMYNDIKNDIISKHGYSVWNQQSYRIWPEVITPQIPKLIESLNSSAYNGYMQQLKELFKSELAGRNDITQILSDFLYYNSAPLLNILIAHDELLIQKKVQEIYPKQSLARLGAALNGATYVIDEIIAQETREAIEKNKQVLRDKIAERELLVASFKKIGFATKTNDINLENKCLWIPASIKHDTSEGFNRRVYGGVSITPNVSFMNNSWQNPMTVKVLYDGMKIYRVWGGVANSVGGSWTTVNPNSVSNYRDAAGLPNVNTGRFVTEGVLRNAAGVWQRPAQPLDGNRGGLHELIVSNPAAQVQMTRVSGVNPPF